MLAGNGRYNDSAARAVVAEAPSHAGRFPLVRQLVTKRTLVNFESFADRDSGADLKAPKVFCHLWQRRKLFVYGNGVGVHVVCVWLLCC